MTSFLTTFTSLSTHCSFTPVPSCIPDCLRQFCSTDKRSRPLRESPENPWEPPSLSSLVPGFSRWVKNICIALKNISAILSRTTHLARQVVNFVCVLSLGELSVEKRHIIIRFILQDLHPLAPARLVLGGLRHGVQLRHCNIIIIIKMLFCIFHLKITVPCAYDFPNHSL